MTYTKKAQVLFTEEQFKILENIAAKRHKKLGTLIREAVEKVYIEKRRIAETANAIDKLLSLPPTPPPKDYQEWEKEYSKLKQPCDIE